MTRIIEPELSYEITGLCFKVQNELGRFCRERQYGDKLEVFLKESGVEYKREYAIKELNKHSPEGNIVDFLIDNKVILDLKAKKVITKEDYIQMQRYLKAANLELGLIVNFRATFLKPKRVLNADFDSGYSDVHSGDSDRITSKVIKN